MTRPRILITLIVSLATVLLVVVLLAVVFMPAIGGRDVKHLVHLQRETHLRQLIQLLIEYAGEHNGELPEPSEWHSVMDPWIGVDRNDPVYGRGESGNILMLPLPWPDAKLPSDVPPSELTDLPALFEDPDLHPDRTVVAFWDGSVRRLSNEEFARLIDSDRAVRLGRPGRQP